VRAGIDRCKRAFARLGSKDQIGRTRCKAEETKKDNGISHMLVGSIIALPYR
jgi:hypothetical protein